MFDKNEMQDSELKKVSGGMYTEGDVHIYEEGDTFRCIATGIAYVVEGMLRGDRVKASGYLFDELLSGWVLVDHASDVLNGEYADPAKYTYLGNHVLRIVENPMPHVGR